MPYPAQVDRNTIIETAMMMLEAEGIEALSLHKLADKLGVKAPSLYWHVGSKVELLKAVNQVTARQLIEAMQSVAHNLADDPQDMLMAMMNIYRQYAYAHPVLYSLSFSPELQIDADLAESLGMSLEMAMAEWVGEAKALEALRGAWAMMHGFIMLELGGNFQRAGDLEAAFQQSMKAYLRGWQKS